MGYTSLSDLRLSVNSAPLFSLKKNPSQDPNSSHPVYPVHPCLSSLRHIAFYLVNCARVVTPFRFLMFWLMMIGMGEMNVAFRSLLAPIESESSAKTCKRLIGRRLESCPEIQYRCFSLSVFLDFVVYD
jgi:hypothetical protein